MYKTIMKIHGLQNKIKTIMFCHDSFKLEGNPVELALEFFSWEYFENVIYIYIFAMCQIFINSVEI